MLRAADADDLLALAELERDANMVGLAHVFPPERYPFPFDAILARWRLVLDDPTTEVLVLDDPEVYRLALFLAYDDVAIRHVAVHPDHWRTGHASAAIHTALLDMAARGTTTAHLWVLTENHRARKLYEHLGWCPTDDRREAPWPPHPVEMRYSISLPPGRHAQVRADSTAQRPGKSRLDRPAPR